jgi:hypothetical protein
VTPEPRDLLRGARATLAEVILPALSDPFAIEQAKTVVRVLLHLDAVIDDAFALEWEEARDLAALLGEASPELEGAQPAGYRALREANIERKRRVAERIHADAAAGHAPAANLLEYIDRQTERDRRWTSPKSAIERPRGEP